MSNSAESWLNSVRENHRVRHDAYDLVVAGVLASRFCNDRCRMSTNQIADAALIADVRRVREAVTRLRRGGFLSVKSPPDCDRGVLLFTAKLPARAEAAA